MEIIIGVILVGVSVGVVFLLVLLWTVRTGQYEDTFTLSERILLQNARKKSSDAAAKKQKMKRTSAAKERRAD